jgi:hypothetical protein
MGSGRCGHQDGPDFWLGVIERLGELDAAMEGLNGPSDPFDRAKRCTVSHGGWSGLATAASIPAATHASTSR